MNKNQGRYERLFGYLGFGIGMIIALIADAPFIGSLFAIFMLVMGFFVGSKVDQVSKGEITAKSIRKPLLVATVIIIVCLSLFSMCTHNESDSLSRCGNCGTMLESKYIYSGGCSRCDGRDW